MIFHIFGGQLSGKTTVIKKLDSKQIASWDVLVDFYHKHHIITNKTIDWTLFDKHRKFLAEELKQFIEDNKDKHIIIESSGRNKLINKTIKEIGDIIPIYMGVPTKEETMERIVHRPDVDKKQAIRFNLSTMFKFSTYSNVFPSIMTIDEAYEFIINKMGEEQ